MLQFLSINYFVSIEDKEIMVIDLLFLINWIHSIFWITQLSFQRTIKLNLQSMLISFFLMLIFIIDSSNQLLKSNNTQVLRKLRNFLLFCKFTIFLVIFLLLNKKIVNCFLKFYQNLVMRLTIIWWNDIH